MSDSSIVKDFKEKSDIYYERVYVNGKDPKRVNRLEILTELIKNDIRADCKLLDAGSGPGICYNNFKEFNIEYYALDISPDNIYKAVKDFSLNNAYIGDVADMPFKNEYFDCVISLGCIEYIKKNHLGIKEISRVLKDGGIAYVSFANIYSPSRIWNESIVKALMYLKYKITNKSFYSRYMHSVKKVRMLAKENNMDVEGVYYLNEIFAGYPVSLSNIILNFDLKLLKVFPFLKYFQSEFIIKFRKKEKF